MNIIPVIAKADTMTAEEIAHFKKQIMNQVQNPHFSNLFFAKMHYFLFGKDTYYFFEK